MHPIQIQIYMESWKEEHQLSYTLILNKGTISTEYENRIPCLFLTTTL